MRLINKININQYLSLIVLSIFLIPFVAKANNSPLLNGTIVRSTDSAKIYYIEGGKKRGIESPSMFSSQFRVEDIITTTPTEVASIATGADMTYKEGALISNRGKVYVVSEGKRRHIDTPNTFVQKGYKWSNIIAVSDGELAPQVEGEVLRIGDKHPNGSILMSPGGIVYVISNGEKRMIPSIEIFDARYKWDEVIRVSQEIIDSYPSGENETYREGTLVLGGDGKVSIIQDRQKRHITSIEVLLSYGFNWGQIRRARDIDINVIGNGQAINAVKNYKEGSLIGANTGAVYRVNNNGLLEYIVSPNIFRSQGYRWSDVIRFPEDVINKYSKGGGVGFRDGALIMYGGKVYVIENNVKRWVSSLGVFNFRGYSWNNVIPVSENEFNSNGMGDSLIDVQTNILDGYSIPATSGRTAREQHLARDCNETDEDHYSRASTPAISRNGLLNTGGAFAISCPNGSRNSSYAPFGVEEEKYYITMRWNYVRWYEATSSLTQNIDSSSNRIPVVSVSDYPNTGWVIINGEIIAFNGKDGNSLIVSQRGVDSPAVASSPRSHNSGSVVQEVYIYRSATGTRPNIWRGRTRTALIANTSQAKNWHRGKKILVTNPANGKKLVASIMESGPAIFTNRVSGLSPEAMLELGAITDSNLEYGFLVDQTVQVGLLP